MWFAVRLPVVVSGCDAKQRAHNTDVLEDPTVCIFRVKFEEIVASFFKVIFYPDEVQAAGYSPTSVLTY